MLYIVCHRGINRKQENTFKSITQVKNLYHPHYRYGVEFDIQLTNEYLFVCYHDETLKRLHNSDIKVNNMTKNEIFRFGIAELPDVLQELSSSDNLVNIEIKYDIENNTQMEVLCDQLIELIQLTNVKNHIITSFNPNIINKLLDMNVYNVGLILCEENINYQLIDTFINKGMRCLIIPKLCFDLITKLNDKDLFIFIYTFFDDVSKYLDDVKLIQSIKEMKTKKIGLITDDHELTLNVLLNDILL